MKMFFGLICTILMIVSPSYGQVKKDKTRRSLQQVAQQKKNLKADPLYPSAFLSHFKTRWDVLKFIRRHLSQEQFTEMRALADRYKVDLRKKMLVGFTKEGGLALPEHKVLYKVAKDGRSFVVNGQTFTWDKNGNVGKLFRSVEESLKNQKTAGVFDFFLFRSAQAKIQASESAGYDMMVALAAQDFYMGGDDHLMYDLMAGDADLVALAARLQQNRGTFQFRCLENGMDMKFSDGTTSQYSFTGEGESFSNQLTETNDSWYFTHDVSGANRNMMNSAWFYVCQKAFYDSGLRLGEWSPDVPVGGILGNPTTWGAGGTTATH